jgi:transcriptional regulator
MYVPDHFRQDDRAAALELIERHAFGLLAAGAEAAHLPFELDRAAGALRCHVARANPLARLAIGAPVLAVFAGPHAYVSPDWYASAGHVPTWNYVAVHVHGTARPLDPPALEAHLEAVVAREEAALAGKAPWTTARVEPRALAALRRGIVGLEIPLERVEAKWKLSQNRTAADRRGVIAGLRRRGGENEVAIAEAMARYEGNRS